MRARRWVVERTHSCLPSLPSHPHPLGETRRHLPRNAPPRLCAHHLASRQLGTLGGIGSKASARTRPSVRAARESPRSARACGAANPARRGRPTTRARARAGLRPRAAARAHRGGTRGRAPRGDRRSRSTRIRTWLLIAGLTGLPIAIGGVIGGGGLYLFAALAVLMATGSRTSSR